MNARKKKMRKNHKINNKTKKITTGAASMLLGAGIMVGANTRPVKAASSREDEITEVDTINVISSETEKADVEQRTDTTETLETEGNVDSTNTKVFVPTDETINTEAQAANNTTQVESTVEDTTQEETTETQQNPSVDNQEPVLSDPPSVESPEDSATEVTTTKTTDEVKNAADEANKENKDKLDAEINKAEDNGHTVTQDGDKVYKADATNIDKIIEDLNQFTTDQIADIDQKLEEYQKQLEAYKADQARYETEVKKYQEAKELYIQKLKDLGLYQDGDIDPSDISQELILGDEQNSTVNVEILNTAVEKKEGSILSGLLNQFYAINERIDGDFLRLTYSGLENTTYDGKKVDHIQIVYSGWNPNNNSTSKYGGGIYFNKKLTDGFFYVKSDGVTMEMTLFDENNNVIELKENSAYITAGSLNSEGIKEDENGNKIENKYIEKAELFKGNGFGGKGIAFQESYVTVHRGPNGGDMLFSEKNNEVLVVYPSYPAGATDEEKKAILAKAIEDQKAKAIAAGWSKEIVDKYIDWDSSIDRSREIFGAGLFNVYGKKIKIRFSNNVGSAWATYTTTIPSFAFTEEEPQAPTVPEPSKLNLTYTPGHIEITKSNVHIHYIDVHGVTPSGENNQFTSDDGTELEHLVDHQLDLIVGTNYSHNLWDYKNAGYQLAEDIKDGVEKGIVTEADQHHYVYLTHVLVETTDEENLKSQATQVIHYVYDDTGEEAAPDYKAETLYFVKKGNKDLTNGHIIWGEWTPTQIFIGVKSPVIKGFHLKDSNDQVVGPDRATITDANYEEGLAFEHTVRYVKNATQELSLTKEVNQVIHYIYENGSQAHDDYRAVTLVFEKKGVKDLETGNETWGEWTKTQTFVVVTSPIIEGYTANRKEVGPYDITVTDENYLTNLDKDDIVIYKANPVTPDIPGPDIPEPTPTPDPEPTPDPTPDPIPSDDEEIATPPLPEEELGNYPSQSDKEEEEERVTPHAPTEPNKKSTEVVPIKANVVNDEDVVPENISTKTTNVAEKKQTTSVNQTNEETLPATGEDKSEIAALLSSLAAALGITGLVGTTKHRKKEDK